MRHEMGVHMDSVSSEIDIYYVTAYMASTACIWSVLNVKIVCVSFGRALNEMSIQLQVAF